MLPRDPMTHKNERCRGERQLARVRFSINISGRPAGHSCDIAIFEAATLVRGLLACTISLAGAHVQFRLMRTFAAMERKLASALGSTEYQLSNAILAVRQRCVHKYLSGSSTCSARNEAPPVYSASAFILFCPRRLTLLRRTNSIMLFSCSSVYEDSEAR
jgi:hypothetical protein